MDDPKTATAFNLPFVGEAHFTATAHPGNFTMASGAAHMAALDRDVKRRRKLFDSLADIIQDPELRRAIVARVVEIEP